MAVSNNVLRSLDSFLKKNFKQASSIQAAFSIAKQDFSALKFENPYCAYVGTNWDGNRHGSLWNDELLIGRLKCFGPKESWDFLPNDLYGGCIPFDGQSVLKVYRSAGIGLELNHPDFDEEGIPTSRTFEIPASSAITIAREGSFSHQTYGDNILIVKSKDAALGQTQQIANHVDWVKANPEKATEMAKATNELFNSKFSLESYLSEIISQALRDKLKIHDRQKNHRSTCTLIVSQEDSHADLNPFLVQQINNLEIFSSVIFLCDEDNVQKVTEKAQKYLKKPFDVFLLDSCGPCASKDTDLKTIQVERLKKNPLVICTNFQSRFYERELISALATVSDLLERSGTQLDNVKTFFCAGIIEKTDDGQILDELLNDPDRIKRSETRRIAQFGSGYLRRSHKAFNGEVNSNGCIVSNTSLVQALQSNGGISSALVHLKKSQKIFFLPEIYVEAKYRDDIRATAVCLACYEFEPAKNKSITFLKHNVIVQRMLKLSYSLIRYLRKYPR